MLDAKHENCGMRNIVLAPPLWASLKAGAGACIEQRLIAEGDHVPPGQTLARGKLIHRPVDVPALHADLLAEIIVPLGETFTPGIVLARGVAT